MKFLVCALVVGHFLTTPLCLGHDQPLHPAYRVAEKYVKATHLHQWSYAVKMIEAKSLQNLKRIQKRFLLNAPTISEEEALLRSLGLSKVADLDALTPTEVFIRRARANTQMLAAADRHVEQMEKSLVLQTLSTAREGSDMVHALLRAKYAINDRAYSELALVSLTKEGTTWKISLDAQEPTVTKLDSKQKKPRK